MKKVEDDGVRAYTCIMKALNQEFGAVEVDGIMVLQGIGDVMYQLTQKGDFSPNIKEHISMLKLSLIGEEEDEHGNQDLPN